MDSYYVKCPKCGLPIKIKKGKGKCFCKFKVKSDYEAKGLEKINSRSLMGTI